MNAPGFFLVVRFSVAPHAESQVMRWLDGGHVAEVLRQPGFLWCKRIKVAEHEYSMIYGIDSKASFDAYNNNDVLMKKFKDERAPFEQHMRIDRFYGEVV